MSELLAFNITDMYGVVIEFSDDKTGRKNIHDFLINPAASDDRFILDDKFVTDRKCKYIVATGGVTDGQVSIQNGSFSVDREALLSEFQQWYELQRYGREWKSGAKYITADQVKQWLHKALVPFNIPTREIKDIYELLRVKCAQADMQVAPLELVTAKDLNTKEYKRPPYIVDGVLYPGLTILAAPAKTGKSFLALDLACSVAEGWPFWNLDTAAGDVLYLDLEGTEWRTNDRLPKVGRKVVPDRLVHAYRAGNIDTGLIQQLESWIAAVEAPKLIILDTLQHCKGRVARGEDAYSAETRFTKPLHDLAIRHGIAILAITHTRKSNGLILDDPFDAVIGSVGQLGNADAGWMIVGKRNDNKKTFVATGRDFESISFEIERTTGGRWQFNGTTEEREKLTAENSYKTNKAVSVIRNAVVRGGGVWKVTAQEFLDEAASETGEYLAVNATRAGRMIHELAPDLLKYDNIVVRWPNKSGGKQGRVITFEQRRFTDNT